jgi:Protein of unknown function (DUF3080)
LPSLQALTPFVYTLITLVLAACGSNAEDAPFERYLARLDTTLGVEAPAFSRPVIPPPPRAGSLKIDIHGGKLDALDFLALHGCELQVTISKRNSSLGRFARNSQRLLLELEFLRLAPACIEKLNIAGKESIAALLQEAWEQKREQLPALIFNATLGSEEYRYFWQTSSRLGTYPSVGDRSVANSLNAMHKFTRQWLSGNYEADNKAFELHLGKIAGGAGGKLLAQLSIQSQWLDNATLMLDQRMTKGPLCRQNLRHSEADILPQVVRRFFVEGIQPRAAVLNRRHYQLFTPVYELEAQLASTLPRDYADWQSARNQSIKHNAGAAKRHVALLQKILQPCNNKTLIPG